MSITKQDLLSLKEENLKFKENFDKFLKNHEPNKKFISKRDVKEFMEEQKTLMDTINHRVDEIIAAKDQDENQQQQLVDTLPQKRRRSEIGGTNKASKRSRKDPIDMKNYFENIVNNPGLQHLAEAIFSNLNFNDLLACQLVNQSSRSILDNPMFWLKKFVQKGISKQNEMDWSKAIQLTKKTNYYEKRIALYLKRSIRKEKVVDIPCFIDEKFLKKCQGRSLRYLEQSYVSPYSKQIGISCGTNRVITEDYISGCIQLLVPFSISNRYGPPDLEYIKTKIDEEMCKAATAGHLKIIKALVPLIGDLKTHYCIYMVHNWHHNRHDTNTDYCYTNPDHVTEYLKSKHSE